MDKTKDFIFDIVETFISSFVVLMVLYMFLAFPEVVSGASMEPHLRDGERILVEKVSKHLSGMDRGDVVVFHPPGDDDVDYVKRVIGIPGDVVKISECGVYVARGGNRFLLEEPYLYDGTCTRGGLKFAEGRSQRVEEESYFLLGDNRANSADSRIFGAIDKERVVGKAIFRFWPISRVSFL